MASPMRRPQSKLRGTKKTPPPGKRRAARRSPAKPKVAPVETPASEEPGEDAVVATILSALAEAATLSPRDIAERVADIRRRPSDGPQLWRRYFAAVKQRALSLARQGRIEIVRKGEVVDPEDFKGIVRYRLSRGNNPG